MNVNGVENEECIYKFKNERNQEDNITTKNKDLDKDAFLRLLTEQLSNQDPLNPIEDKEFISQMAQFTELEQVQNLNKSLGEFQTEIKESINNLDVNQTDANIEILKQLISINKAVSAYGTEDNSEE